MYLVYTVSVLQVPQIDSRREGGEKPKELKGNIEFRGVRFNYPARPEVEVCCYMPHYTHTHNTLLGLILSHSTRS